MSTIGKPHPTHASEACDPAQERQQHDESEYTRVIPSQKMEVAESVIVRVWVVIVELEYPSDDVRQRVGHHSWPKTLSPERNPDRNLEDVLHQ